MAAYRQPCHCGKLIPLRWHHPSPGDIHISYSFLVADGSFSCIAECAVGFTLGETKEELLRVLGLQGKKGSSLGFLRRGYKTATWFEEDLI
ncbi:protein LPA3-like [Solanum stenotomum]|uniref:protein LPA3-like n=1 Tax=Solanum stenotomum TaxID=172797 RepID=UPI0020D0A3EA|nr:protein LPA3-like [Solanum stenotomum]